MKLSIVIVNYNVRYFLQHCLLSVQKACGSLDAEVIVIDNASTDGSAEMMKEEFAGVQYHYLDKNLGFSKANNIGIHRAKGEYVLLLNPDTLVRENTFTDCVRFMDGHPDAGGLGVKMVDGNGHFLPESKRGLPTPSVAFYKVFGFSRLFPKSRRFNQYHLGYLDENAVHEVDVLSGAFMLLRKTALEKTGLLDEDYFMYGEDIDLSYRITKAGYRNYYFPDTQIIHYKGESTKKGSLNYVFVFYRAMIIFARKHLEKGQASLFGVLINMAIYFRAMLALLRRLFGRSWQFLLDFVFIYAIFYNTTWLYSDIGHKDFSLPFISLALPAYSFILCIVLFYTGVYDRPFQNKRLFQGWAIGLLFLLAFYALLPEQYRFSRAVILIGASASLVAGLLWRHLLHFITGGVFRIGDSATPTRRLVVGNEDSFQRVNANLEKTGLPSEFIAGVTPVHKILPLEYIATIGQLPRAISDFAVQEVIFCVPDMDYEAVIRQLINLRHSAVQPLIYVKAGDYMIGANTVVKPGKFESTRLINKVHVSALKRNKRTFDILFSFIALLLSPVMIFLADRPRGYFSNIAAVFTGNRTWVGYDPRGENPELPVLKKGVVHPMMHIIWPDKSEEHAFRGNVAYIVNHRFLSDLQVIFRHVHGLGN